MSVRIGLVRYRLDTTIAASFLEYSKFASKSGIRFERQLFHDPIRETHQSFDRIFLMLERRFLPSRMRSFTPRGRLEF